MDFRNAKELLKVCQEQGLSISAVMLQRELTEENRIRKRQTAKWTVFLRS